MNNYNPMLDYQRNQLLAQQAVIQNQLNQMNRPIQAQFSPYPQPSQPQFFVRQVGSVDEAKAFPVDPNTMYFFLDTGNGKIYMKQLNSTNGKSDLYTYAVQESVEEKKIDPIEEINNRLINIEKLIGGKYDKSVSSDERNEKSNGNDSKAGFGKNEKSKPANVSASPTDDSGQK